MKRVENVEMSFWPKYAKENHPWSRITTKKLIELRFSRGLTHKEIAEKYGVPKTEVSLMMTKVLNLEPQWAERRMPETLTKENPHLGYVLGVAYGDASIAANSFRFGVTDSDFFENVRRELMACGFREDEFYIKKIPRRKNTFPSGKTYLCKSMMRLELNCLEFVEFLKNLKPLEFSHEQKAGFINGFFDSEASISENGRRVILTNTNLEMLETISKILREFGIETQPKFLRIGGISATTGNQLKDVYRLYIPARSIPAFRKHFRLSIARKQARLEGQRLSPAEYKSGRFVMKLASDSDENRATVVVMRRGKKGETTESKSFTVDGVKSIGSMAKFMKQCIRHNAEVRKLVVQLSQRSRE